MQAKRMKTIFNLIPLLLLAFFVVSCTGGAVPQSPTTTVPQPTTTTPATTISFDFDRGLPVLSVGQSMPFDQTSGGVTAHFTSPSDPAAFSVQSHDTTFLMLPQFSGKYLYPSRRSRTNLSISFSQPLNGITLTFATTDYHGVGEVDEPTAVKLTAYTDTTTLVGTVTARGTFPTNYTFPQGTLSFDSGSQPFNLVVIELLVQRLGGTNFLVDNIAVTTANPKP